MNRHVLAEATSLHEGPVPMYLMEEIANTTKTSERDAEKTADYLLGRLHKSNLTVKLKALQLLAFCLKEGSGAFIEVIRDEEQEIVTYLQFSGAPDPVYGDEKYRRIRMASQEVLVCLNDGLVLRQHKEALQQQQLQQQLQPPPGSVHTWQVQVPLGENALASGTLSGAYSQGGQTERQQSSVGGLWGQSHPSSQPAPYQDSQFGGYNGASGGGYNGLSGAKPSLPPGRGCSGYADNSYGQNGGNSGGYGCGQNGAQSGYGPNALPQQQQQQQQASGFNSWVSSSGSGVASKSSGAGIWSSSGYQKKDSAGDNEPRYNPCTRRDNRPTVLVGHSLNFPKPAGGFGSSNTAATSGLGGFNSGTYDSNAIRGAIGTNTSNSNAMGSSVRGGFGGHQSGGTAAYVDNSNRMSGTTHRIGSIGLPVNGQPLSDVPTTALGKKAEVLKKMGTAALEKWDRRNMDKSMASSLADHDELRAGPQVIDHNYYQPNAQQGTGGGDTSRDYERTMIDNLCAPAGLSRAPPADGLKRFVDLAQTLDAQTIGDILLDKLEDETWQVRLKGLHVVLALFDSPAAAPYQEFFEENVEVFEELRKDAKPSVVSKALQVLRALGYANDVSPQPTTKRAGARQSQRGSPTMSLVQQPQQEVDLLGFDSLCLESSADSLDHSAQGTADLFGSPMPPPVSTPFQEVSLLDGFDTLASSSSYSSQQRQAVPPQQQYYEQPEQVGRNKALSHFEKDLLAIGNSPTAGTAPPSGISDGQSLSGGQSAFNFL